MSDVTAVGEWPIAREALDLVGEAEPEEDDFEHVAPAGDLDIFADLGMGAMELSAVCSDLELYPDEMLGQIAARIGFGPQFDRRRRRRPHLTDQPGGDPVSYFTAVLAREGRRWTAHDVDVESLKDLGELTDELRAVADDDEPVLLFLEREDAWWAVVRVDGDEDPRVFVSDAAGAAASSYSELLELDGDEETSPSRAPAPETSTCSSTSARRPRR